MSVGGGGGPGGRLRTGRWFGFEPAGIDSGDMMAAATGKHDDFPVWPGRNHSPRHPTCINPRFSQEKWHPMTRQATYARGLADIARHVIQRIFNPCYLS